MNSQNEQMSFPFEKHGLNSKEVNSVHEGKIVRKNEINLSLEPSLFIGPENIVVCDMNKIINKNILDNEENIIQAETEVPTNDFEYISGDANIRVLPLNSQSKNEYHKCDSCDKSFTSNFSLKRHTGTFHSTKDSDNSNIERKFKCQWCVKMFTTSFGMRRHIQSFHSEHQNALAQKQTCDICCKSFFSESKLVRHKMKQHGIKIECQYDHKCDICTKTFFSAIKLTRHKMEIHKIKSKCQWCVKTFTSLFRMKCHNDRYHSDYDSKIQKKFECLWCSSSFTSSQSMQRHVSKFHPEHENTLAQKKKFQKCDICGKRIKVNKLKKHKRKEHGTSKPEPKCDNCCRTFKSRHYLRIHVLKHCDHLKSVEKIYKCSWCVKSFSSLFSMKRHISKFHPEGEVQNIVECDSCGKSFVRESKLIRHKMKIHRIKSKCQWCDICNKFFKENRINQHKMKQHGIKIELKTDDNCDICTKTFFNAIELIKHNMKIHKIKSKCQWCVKTFTSLRGLKCHNDKYHSDYDSKIQKKFECQWCIRTFTSSKSMQRHVGIFHPEHENTLAQNQKYHKCDICSKIFYNIKYYMWHMDTFHKDTAGLPNDPEKNLEIKMENTSPEKNDESVSINTPSENVVTNNPKNLPEITEHLLEISSQLNSIKNEIEENETMEFQEAIKIQCNICDKVFTTEKSLRLHVNAIHEEQDQKDMLTCKFCSKQFFRHRKSDLRKHVRNVHEGKKDYECNICGKLSAYRSELNRHMKEIHDSSQDVHEGQKSYNCLICSKSFSRRRNLSRHIKTCKKSHHCYQCNELFYQTQDYIEHIREFHDAGNFFMINNKLDSTLFKDKICQLCGKKLSRIEYFKRHIEIFHKQQKLEIKHRCEICSSNNDSVILKAEHLKKHIEKYHLEQSNKICDMCGKFFPETENLILHIKVDHPKLHQAKICDSCGMSFTNTYKMKHHIIGVHGGPKPYKCDICDKTFRFSDRLNAHIKDFHKDCQKTSCDKCDKSFLTAKNLKVHLMGVHKEGILRQSKICEICNKTFPTLYRLKIHKRRIHEGEKDYKCNYCEKFFSTPGYLKLHIRELHEDNKKDYTCETCGYSCFRPETLKRHKYTVHEGHKDHQCIFCLESFTQSWTLRRHVNTFHKDSAVVPKNPEKVILNKMVNNGSSENIEESVASVNIPEKHLLNSSVSLNFHCCIFSASS